MLLLPLIWVLAGPSSVRAQDASPLKARFKEIRQTSLGLYGFYTITNVGARDIDDVILHLHLENKDGDTLSSIAVTDATPGLVWLKAGESIEEGVPLDHAQRRAAKALLETDPHAANLVLDVKHMTFMKQ
jgi:hypothetical protein